MAVMKQQHEDLKQLMLTMYETGFSVPTILEHALDFAMQLVGWEMAEVTAMHTSIEHQQKAVDLVQMLAREIGIHPLSLRQLGRHD